MPGRVVQLVALSPGNGRHLNRLILLVALSAEVPSLKCVADVSRVIACKAGYQPINRSN